MTDTVYETHGVPFQDNGEWYIELKPPRAGERWPKPIVYRYVDGSRMHSDTDDWGTSTGVRRLEFEAGRPSVRYYRKLQPEECIAMILGCEIDAED